MSKVAALVLVLTSATLARAAPLFVAHQGRLLDGEDRPITAELPITFAIYTVEADPTGEAIAPRWKATYQVKVAGGLYSVLLGDTSGGRDPLTPETFDGDDRLWLGVAVDGGAELRPRLAITASPIALRAGHAATADDAKTVGGETPAQLHDAAKLTGVAPASVLGSGSTAITTLGTIATGTWQGTPVDDAHVAGAARWDAKMDAVSHDGSLAGDGKGSPLKVVFGTAAGTAAAGDDARFGQLATAVDTAKSEAISAAGAATDGKLASYLTKTEAEQTFVTQNGGGLRTATPGVKNGMQPGEAFSITHPADPDRLVTVLAKGAAGSSAVAIDFEDGVGKDLVSGIAPTFTGGQSSVGTTAKFGSKALYFYDYTHYASWALPAGALNLGTGDFTIRFWFRTNEGFLTGGYWANVVGTHYSDSTASGGWVVGMNSLGGLRFLRSGSLNTFDLGTKYAANRWYHVAIERSSGTIRAYVDGVSIGSVDDTSAIGGSASTLYVGGLLDWDNAPQAWVDDVEIIKTASYRGANFTPPSSSDLSSGTVWSVVNDPTRFRVDYLDDTTTRVTKLSPGTESVRAVVHTFQ